jgi:hypothetical protein
MDSHSRGYSAVSLTPIGSQRSAPGGARNDRDIWRLLRYPRFQPKFGLRSLLGYLRRFLLVLWNLAFAHLIRQWTRTTQPLPEVATDLTRSKVAGISVSHAHSFDDECESKMLSRQPAGRRRYIKLALLDVSDSAHAIL